VSEQGEVAGTARGWSFYRQPLALRMLAFGFSSGLPYLLVFGTLSFRLREAGIDRSTIGFLSWVLLAYAFKWAWAPVVDRVALPLLTRRLGRRRAWLLLAQVGIAAGLASMAVLDPRTQLFALAAAAVFTAFAAATQDIALDAWRIESAPPESQAALAAVYQVGYRIGWIWAGAGALWIAQAASSESAPSQGAYEAGAWLAAYGAMALSALAALLVTLTAPEGAMAPAAAVAPGGANPFARWTVAIVEPFLDLVRRYRWHALGLLALISVYRMPSIVMGVMANAFYKDVGFTKGEVAAVSKVYGVAMALAGAAVAGVWVPRVGLRRMLFLAAAASSATILPYVLIANTGHDLRLLVLTISADNFAEGVAGTCFIAFLSGLTRAGFSATQYALLSSIALLLPKLVAGFSGVAVDRVGYPAFFTACSLGGLASLVLLALVLRSLPDQRFSNR
jgi:PAT family beta-lactamase induction signal transducer AmpG